jgi:hypothetical protein
MTAAAHRLVSSPSLIACWISTLAVAAAIFATPNFVGDRSPIQHDEKSYYTYLPALVIHHDIRLGYYAADPTTQSAFVEASQTPDGKYFLKMTCGVALFELPFFLVAHAYSLLFDEPSGYSAPYKLLLIVGGAFYGCTALFVLRALLRRYFSELVTAAVILSLMLGTNLFWYTYFEGMLSHVYLFFTFVMVLWLTVRWHEQATMLSAVGLGFLCGMALLTRPTDGLIALFPILYGITSKEALQRKVRLVKQHSAQIGMACVALLLPNLLQLLYWKTATDHWILYSYLDEKILLTHPHLIKGLFGFRKGLFLYTPIMLFAAGGLFVCSRRLPALFYPMIAFLILHVYLVLSWWCWWYGGSFGMRGLVESYAVLALPLAAAYERLFAQRTLRSIAVGVIGLLIGLNQFQIYQYRERIIDFERMTGPAYWFVFLKPSLSDAERQHLQSLLDYIDYRKALNGED